MKLGKTLKGLGFEQSLIDPCVFRLMDGDEVKVLIVVHVDDMFVVGTENVCNKLAEDLNVHFPTKTLENWSGMQGASIGMISRRVLSSCLNLRTLNGF